MNRRLTFSFLAVAVAALAAAAATAIVLPPPVAAATSVACDGGDFSLTLPGGRVLSGYNGWKIDASALPSHSRIHVQGRYIQFDLDVSDYAVYDYALTGAPNALDMTRGVFTPIFAAKTPDLKGRTLDSGELEVQLSPQSLVTRRRGGGAGMKIQAKDCATGGIFQIEPDQQTVFTHRLAPGVFYFRNPLTGKINYGDGANLIGKDSPQVATKLAQFGDGSIWRVEAGGRMGMVLGEDAIELAAGAPPCTQQCQIQNQVRDTLPAPGF
jgi:hypothetical protein